jgi:hypothetical protein
MTTKSCRVLAEAMKAKATLSELAGCMRKLRKALPQCERCPEQSCPLVKELSTEITAALLELTDEWNL